MPILLRCLCSWFWLVETPDIPVAPMSRRPRTVLGQGHVRGHGREHVRLPNGCGGNRRWSQWTGLCRDQRRIFLTRHGHRHRCGRQRWQRRHGILWGRWRWQLLCNSMSLGCWWRRRILVSRRGSALPDESRSRRRRRRSTLGCTTTRPLGRLRSWQFNRSRQGLISCSPTGREQRRVARRFICSRKRPLHASPTPRSGTVGTQGRGHHRSWTVLPARQMEYENEKSYGMGSHRKQCHCSNAQGTSSSAYAYTWGSLHGGDDRWNWAVIMDGVGTTATAGA